MRKRLGLALGLAVAAGLGCSRGRPTHPDGTGAPPAGDPSPPAPGGAAGLERLHGTWAGTEERGQPMTLTFGPGDAVLVRVGPDSARGTYATDWGQSPAHLDIEWGGRKVRAIVELTPGGSLRMEDRGPGQDRPRQFGAKAKVLTRPSPPAPGRGVAAAGLGRLHGTWAGTDERGQPISLTFGPGDAVAIRVGPDTGRGTYAVDWGQAPAHLDLDLGGRTVRTIVELTPGGLRMEDRDPGQDRPRQFGPRAKVLTRAGGR